MIAHPFPVVYAETRADGWPFCPRCGADELWGDYENLRGPVPLSEWRIVACYACRWTPGTDPRPVVGEP